MNTRGTLIRSQDRQWGRARRWAGFSLIELMTVLAVAAVALMVAVPGVTSVVTSNRLGSVASGIGAAVTQARITAIKTNLSVQFCSSIAANNNTDTLGAQCGSDLGAVWWIEPKDGNKVQVLGPVPLPPNVTVSNVAALRFSGNGLATTATGTSLYSGLVADVYSTQVKVRNHRCVYLTTGTLVSICTTSAACDLNNEPRPCSM